LERGAHILGETDNPVTSAGKHFLSIIAVSMVAKREREDEHSSTIC
jgi:hypothetical protein